MDLLLSVAKEEILSWKYIKDMIEVILWSPLRPGRLQGGQLGASAPALGPSPAPRRWKIVSQGPAALWPWGIISGPAARGSFPGGPAALRPWGIISGPAARGSFPGGPAVLRPWGLLRLPGAGGTISPGGPAALRPWGIISGPAARGSFPGGPAAPRRGIISRWTGNAQARDHFQVVRQRPGAGSFPGGPAALQPAAPFGPQHFEKPASVAGFFDFFAAAFSAPL